MNINEWAADQCGVLLDLDNWEYGYQVGDEWEYSDDHWSIHNPRCREIVREHFKIWTYYGSNRTDKMRWISTSAYNNMDYIYGKTIAEAEIGCIEAIYEASKNGS